MFIYPYIPVFVGQVSLDGIYSMHIWHIKRRLPESGTWKVPLRSRCLHQVFDVGITLWL